jgi:WD40 repeat protein
MVATIDHPLSLAVVGLMLSTMMGHGQEVAQDDQGPVQVLRPRIMGVCPLAYSPDSKTLATGEGYDQICLWDIVTGRGTGRLKIELQPQLLFVVSALAYSPDGKTLAAGYTSQSASAAQKAYVRIWDISTGKVMRELLVQENSVDALVFSPDGGALAAAGTWGKVHV